MDLSYRTKANAEIIAKVWGKSRDNPEWWSVQASTDEAEEILIYDYIGWPFNDPYELKMHMNRLGGKDVVMRINSPGGDVFDGLAIYGAMQDYPGNITTEIDGLAASMASVLAVGGAEARMKKSAMMMIHEPWTIVGGDQHLMRDVADVLGKIAGNLVDIYAAKVGGKKPDLKDKLKNDTWFTAQEAKEYGLADTVIDQPAAKAGFDLSVFGNVPDEMLRADHGRELNEREIERALREAGASRNFAKAVVTKNYKPLRDAEAESEIKKLINLIKP